MTLSEFQNQTSNEAIQLNLIFNTYRRQLLRMAPWNCGLKTANLQYITSAPGTPENTSAATTLWAPGQPPPPWAYEYQYPEDCVRACWIIPATQTGFSGGVPITTAVTGGAAAWWRGPPVTFKVQTDTFYGVTAAAVANGGTGYAVGDQITLAVGPNTSPPIGAPAILQVSAVSGGVITGVSVVPSIYGEDTPQTGAYFTPQTAAQAQGSTTGVGSGATFNLTFTSAAGPQRIITTNQEFATLNYIQDVTDPNVMDDLFQEAWVRVLGSGMVMSLSGDKKLANGLIAEANRIIEIARTPDGNEGLTINDHTPDWIRTRGIRFEGMYSGPYSNFDWGDSWAMWG
jgi:hypothetical protein